MDDEELQAIRAQRMAQLQSQYGVSVVVQRLLSTTLSLAVSVPRCIADDRPHP